MSVAYTPGYLDLASNGELRQRAAQAYQRLENCDLCAWECRVNRLVGRIGVCLTGKDARVSSYGPHLGEELPLRGWRGSGTIFFNRCNLRCQYCQNHSISQTDTGYLVTPEDLAAIMLELQDMGCHNINLVSPSHIIPQFLAGLLIAVEAGLNLPIVYNTGGYDSLSSLKLLDGVIDLYLPDMKYASAQIARHYSKIPHYPESNQAAVIEMHRQVGDLVLDQHQLAQRGLLVRHLVLPHNLAGTEQILSFLAEKVSLDTYLNLMDQYRPEYNVKKYPNQFPKLNRTITPQEHHAALQIAQRLGFQRLD